MTKTSQFKQCGVPEGKEMTVLLLPILPSLSLLSCLSFSRSPFSLFFPLHNIPSLPSLSLYWLCSVQSVVCLLNHLLIHSFIHSFFHSSIQLIPDFIDYFQGCRGNGERHRGSAGRLQRGLLLFRQQGRREDRRSAGSNLCILWVFLKQNLNRYVTVLLAIAFKSDPITQITLDILNY